MRARRFMGLLAAVVGALLAMPLPAAPQQAAPQRPSISVKVNVVNIYATVRKKHGEIVRNLNKDDFLLEDDGRPQTISYFSQESDLPLTLGLVVDTSMSVRSVLGEERNASSAFLDQVLRVDKDQAFVIHFDRQVELLQDLTSSRQKLQAALALIETPEMVRRDPDDPQSPEPGSPSGPRGYGGGGTLLYDAVYLASNQVMSHQQGRKALIVLSDGVDRGSQETLASAVEAAQRADTLVYSILFTGEQGYGNRGWGGGMGRRGGMGGMGGMGRRGGGRYPQESRPDGKKILEQISKETGGALYEASSKQPLDQVYDSIQQELRNQYYLGYTPNPKPGPGYHKITLTAKEKDMTVQSRTGYYYGAAGAAASGGPTE